MEESDKFKFEDLKVYQKALDYIDNAYDLSKKIPSSEIYGLTSQYLRAAQSIALNIAEGSGGTTKEFIKFLRISRNSIKECVVCLTIAKRREYITNDEDLRSRHKLIELSKMISGLIQNLKKKLDN